MMYVPIRILSRRIRRDPLQCYFMFEVLMLTYFITLYNMIRWLFFGKVFLILSFLRKNAAP